MTFCFGNSLIQHIEKNILKVVFTNKNKYNLDNTEPLAPQYLQIDTIPTWLRGVFWNSELQRAKIVLHYTN